jgi:hypothetical protein
MSGPDNRLGIQFTAALKTGGREIAFRSAVHELTGRD